MADQPWHGLPPMVVDVLRPALDDVAGDIIAAVSTVPAYSRPMEGPFGAGVRIGVQEALRHFLAEIEVGGPVDRGDVYRALGRGEMRAGRSLDALLSAYRAGARVAWRRFAALGVEAGLEPDTLYLLAESLFAYIDVLSAESAEGHAMEQSAVAGELQLRRRRLVRMLVRESPAEQSALEAAAAEAGWTPPRTLAVMAIAGEGREAVAARLPAGTIRETVGDVMCAIVADPDGPGQRSRLERAVVAAGADAPAGPRAGLGTTVDWTEARVSFVRARAALALTRDGAAFVVARERAGELLLGSDPGLAAELASDRLAPFVDLPAGSRQRLTETLRVWLAEQGRLNSVAHRLGIHPQTARYRVGRLRDLFGDALDDPEARFWLEVALRITGDA